MIGLGSDKYAYQAERELLDMFEDSEASRDHPKMIDVVQGALQAEGFSLSSIRSTPRISEQQRRKRSIFAFRLLRSQVIGVKCQFLALLLSI